MWKRATCWAGLALAIAIALFLPEPDAGQDAPAVARLAQAPAAPSAGAEEPRLLPARAALKQVERAVAVEERARPSAGGAEAEAPASAPAAAKPTAALFGLVYDRATLAPLPAAVVRAPNVTCGVAPADAYGCYRVAGLSCGTTAHLNVALPFRAAQEVAVEVSDAAEQRADLAVDAGVEVLRGVAFDAESNEPVHFAEVAADGRTVGRTRDDGSFEVWVARSRDAGAPLRAAVGGGGYARTARTFDLSTVALERRERFPLVRSCTVEGTVTEVGGQPVQQAFVYLAELATARVDAALLPAVFPAGSELAAGEPYLGALTATNGRYRIDGVPPWTTFPGVRSDVPGVEATPAGPLRFALPGERATRDFRAGPR